MARICTICTHSHKDDIDRALVDQVAYRTIADRYGVSKSALIRHKADHLPAAMVKAQEARDMVHSIDVMTELKRCFERVNLLFDACDRWLRDPENPDRYDIGPRAEDVSVTYSVITDGKPVRRKEKLSAVLATIAQSGRTVEWVEVKHADPRELVLKTASQLQGQTELLAKLVGELDDRPTVNVTLSPEWLSMRSTLVDTLAPFPQARSALAGALLNLEASLGHSRN